MIKRAFSITLTVIGLFFLALSIFVFFATASQVPANEELDAAKLLPKLATVSILSVASFLGSLAISQIKD